MRAHLAFIASRPYLSWELITTADFVVGAVYVTRSYEIGLFIFRKFQGHGYGSRTIRIILKRHGEKSLLANINPNNIISKNLFMRHGFQKIQETYRFKAFNDPYPQERENNG
jgi:RimJ/RimL family protein N-acetyltransferase